jgi:hypothetical protein
MAMISEIPCTFMALGPIAFKGSFAFEAIARVVKLVDTRDLKSLGIIYRAGSTPALGTRFGASGQLIYCIFDKKN